MASSKCSIELTAGHCEPCKGGVPPLTKDEYAPLLEQLGCAWEVIQEKCLVKTFDFPDFLSAVEFVNKVAAAAEIEQHHPDLEVSWGKVVVRLWTHKIGGLTRNDFILAAKIESLFLEGSQEAFLSL